MAEFSYQTIQDPPTNISHYPFIKISREPWEYDEILVEFPDGSDNNYFSYLVSRNKFRRYLLEIGMDIKDAAYAESLLWNFFSIIIKYEKTPLGMKLVADTIN